MSIFFVDLPLEPRGKGRPRLARRGRHSVAYTPQSTLQWERAAAQLMRAAWRQPPIDYPVRLVVDAVKARPQRLQAKRHPDGEMWRPHKPDADNCAKITMDSLEKAGVLQNDIVVVELICRSLYAARDAGPSVRVRIEHVAENPCG